MSKVNYSNLYLMRDKLYGTYVRPELVNYEIGSENPLRVSPKNTININFDFKKKVSPILWGSHTSIILISKTLRTVLEQNKISGWKTYDIKIINNDEVSIEEYFGLTVTGIAGNRDLSRSEKTEHNNIGFYLVNDYEDGSDFMLAGKTNYIVISKKLRDILKNLGIKNTEFIPLPQVKISNLIDKYLEDKNT